MNAKTVTVWVLLIVLGILPAAVRAQPAPVPADEPLTLAHLEQLADAHNPIIRRDLAQVEAARGSAIQAGTYPNPQFNSGNPEVLNGRTSLLNAGFTQEIPVMGKKRLDQAAANQGTRQAETTLLQDRFAMLTQIRQQFYQVLSDQRRVEVLTELAGLVERSYETGQKRKKAGEGTGSDVLLLLIDLQRVQASLQNANALLAGDRKQLGVLVGLPGLVDRDLTGALTGSYPTFDEAVIDHYVSTESTQIRNAQSVLKQNELLLKRAEVEPYPNPTLGPAYQFGLVPGNDQFWFNITFPIPIWDRNQGNIWAARANVRAAAETIDTTRNVLLNQAANLRSQYLAAKALVDQFEQKIIPNTVEASRLSQDAYAKGLIDFSTYLQTQRTVVQANSDFVDALQNLWSNAAQLAGVLQVEHFP